MSVYINTLYPVTTPFCSSGSSHWMTIVEEERGRTWTFLGEDPGPENCGYLDDAVLGVVHLSILFC